MLSRSVRASHEGGRKLRTAVADLHVPHLVAVLKVLRKLWRPCLRSFMLGVKRVPASGSAG
jgi:hypothetical protein